MQTEAAIIPEGVDRWIGKTASDETVPVKKSNIDLNSFEGNVRHGTV